MNTSRKYGRQFLSSLLVLSAIPALGLSRGGSQPAPEKNVQKDDEQKESKRDFVYVSSNKEANSIIAYSRDEDGELDFIGEFPTGGKGVSDTSLKLGPFDSDQDVITNGEHTLLFAVNSGSDTIAVFHIKKDGKLETVSGSPFSSHGTMPVGLGLSRETLVIVNKAMDAARPTQNKPNYVSVNVSPDGELESSPISSVPAPVGSSPTQPDMAAGNRLVFDAQFLGGHLQSFSVEPNGAIIPADSQVLPDSEFADTNMPHAPLGLATHPALPILYVGFVTINRLAVYTFNASGDLEFVRTVRNSGKAICWLRTNADGTRIYAVNTADSSVSVYDNTRPLKPVEIQYLKLKGVGNPFQPALDSRGEYLYVLTQRADPTIPLGQGNTLHVLRIKRDGRLTEDGSPVKIPVPDGVRPQGIVSVEIP